MTVPKLTKDGKVAVIVSYGCGAGWSTWGSTHNEKMLFDPVIVQMLLEDKPIDEIEDYAKATYPGEYVKGLRSAVVEWVPVGSRFKIDEYDGDESLTIIGPDYGYIA